MKSKNYLLILCICVMILLVACTKSTQKTGIFVEKQVDSEHYLYVAGVDTSGNIVIADDKTIRLFDGELNFISEIKHDMESPFTCYVDGSNVYAYTRSSSIIHQYTLSESELLETGVIDLGVSNESIVRLRHMDTGLHIMTYIVRGGSFKLYTLLYADQSIVQHDIEDLHWFDLADNNNLVVSLNRSPNTTKAIAIATYNPTTKTLNKPKELDIYFESFTYGGAKNIVYSSKADLLSLNMEDGTRNVVYTGSSNAALTPFIVINKDHFYLSDNSNDLLIKIPMHGFYTTGFIAQDINSGKNGSEQSATNKEQIVNFELSQIQPKSLDIFELTILTNGYWQPETKAEVMFKRLYPNAKIKYERIIEPAIKTQKTNVFEEEYDKELKLRLMANDKSFDIFYISSPQTLTQVVQSGGYLDLGGNAAIQASMEKMFDGVVKNCTYNGSVFGMPKQVFIKAKELNDELVKRYNIDYPFKSKPLLITEISDFAEKYCKDYNNDGEMDVFIGALTEMKDGEVIHKIDNLLLSRRYNESYINYLGKDGFYDLSVINAIENERTALMPYLLKSHNLFDSRIIFPGVNDFTVSLLDNKPAAFLPIFEDKEVYPASYTYICGNKFSENKAYIQDFIACVVNELCIDWNTQQIYKDIEVYEKYIPNCNIDRDHYNFYKRIIDNSVARSMLSWEANLAIVDTRQAQRDLFNKGLITEEEMYKRINQKLDMILKE